MAGTYIYRIENKSSEGIHLLHRSSQVSRSYDVFVAPGTTLEYDEYYGSGSMPVPVSHNASEFDREYILLQVSNQLTYRLYQNQDAIHVTSDSVWQPEAPCLTGYAQSGTIELVIDEHYNLTGKLHRFITHDHMAAVKWAEGRYAIYGVDQQGQIVEKAWLTQSWSPWRTIDSPDVLLAGPIAAVSWIAGRYAVYALGKDGKVYERSWLTTEWSDWTDIGAPNFSTTDPNQKKQLISITAVSWAVGRYGIYAVSSDGELYEKWWETDHWHDWSSLGKPPSAKLTDKLTAVAWTTGRYGIYAVGSDGVLWQKWFGGSWHDWESLGQPEVNGVKTSLLSVGSVCWAEQRYGIYAVGADGNLWQNWYAPWSWSGWGPVQRPKDVTLNGPLAAIAWATGRYGVYTSNENGKIYQWWSADRDMGWSEVEGN